MIFETLSKEELVAVAVDQKYKIDYLQFELDQLKKAVFGSKSERFMGDENPMQAKMFEEPEQEDVVEAPDEDPPTEVVEKKKKRKKPKRQKLPAHLRREETIIEPEVSTEQMTLLGQEVSEKLEYSPAEIYVRSTIRPKYLDNKGAIHIADLNDPFPKYQAGPSLVSHVAVQKYVDHLPLYRQSKIFKREQIEIPRSTLNGMIAQGMKKVKKLFEVLNQKVMASDYIQADESSIPVLNKDKPGSAVKGCMLVKLAPKEKLVVFDYIKTKEKKNILKSLEGFKGHLQVDGNVSYEGKGTEDEVTLMHCLVHSRRKFQQALAYDEQNASHVLTEIKKLYLIERKAIAKAMTDDDIYTLRQAEAVPILENLKKWLEKNKDTHPPKTPMHIAVRYMLTRWAGLIAYTTHGKLRPDNNLIENQIRPLALGRKNYLFAGSHQGAKYAALYYSLFATCRLNGIDPTKWLTDVFYRVDDHHINKLDELLPVEGYQLAHISDH